MAKSEQTVTEAFLEEAQPQITSAELIDYAIDHGQQLASMAISAGRPKAAALFTLAVAELRSA